ncbi:hypothetical protein [Bifidobacterium pseudolongum]|uniref:hypothetical protein n=1 Tax=Bifidobacterium pseudolongum TaxID=1694 RepID=UPI0010D97795|nr:integrase [Bifidobacterium pseudolongum subsp. globosum]
MASLRREREGLAAELAGMRAERDRLAVELEMMRYSRELVGKEPGADPDNLTNSEKTRVVVHLAAVFGLRHSDLLERVGVARSTFYHNLKQLDRPGRDEWLPGTGPGRVRAKPPTLRVPQDMARAARPRHPVCAKRVMRLMTRHGITPRLKRRKRHNS